MFRWRAHRKRVAAEAAGDHPILRGFADRGRGITPARPRGDRAGSENREHRRIRHRRRSVRDTSKIKIQSPGIARIVMAKTVADQFAETLAAAGVKRIYGIVGDSLNGLTDSIRRQGKIEWIHVRHEEVAAFAAGAGGHLA